MEEALRRLRTAQGLFLILVITICAAICGVDGWVAVEQFGWAEQAWSAQQLTEGEVVTVDGKQLRRSHDAPAGKAAIL